MRPNVLLLAGLALVPACQGGGDDTSPMAGMTAEEHARMQAGGALAQDSMGAAVRQAVHLTPEEEKALGVVYLTVGKSELIKAIRTVGEIQAPEPGVADVTPKIEGYVERLFVSTTGETVRRGQPILTLYSPALVAAQEEFLTARRLADRVERSATEAWQAAQATLDAARRRLEYWDITADQIQRLETSGTVSRTLTLVSPVTGVVLAKEVFEGQRVMPGERLYRIADLTTVWVEGEVFEQDLAQIQVGSQAHIEVAAYPGEHRMGQVSFVYPVVDVASRTNRVRVTIPNRDLRLKPGMFATLFFDVVVGRNTLAVPMAAVVVTGERNLVFVRDAEGMLVPREVVLGSRAGDQVQVLSGLAEGETIVGSANFLVDAESRLAATGRAMPGMQHTGHGQAAPPPPPTPEHKHD